MKRSVKSLLLAVAVAAMALGMTGCASTDAETANLSSRPSNSPRGWEKNTLANLGIDVNV